MDTLTRFQEVSVCPYCEGETVERHGQTVCLECEISLEGEKPYRMFECSICKELKHEEACTCHEQEYVIEEDERR